MSLAAALISGSVDSLSGDWPGWDDGWTLVVFPLGIPVALLLGLRRTRLAALGTLAVWAWGAVVVGAWWLLGG